MGNRHIVIRSRGNRIRKADFLEYYIMVIRSIPS